MVQLNRKALLITKQGEKQLKITAYSGPPCWLAGNGASLPSETGESTPSAWACAQRGLCDIVKCVRQPGPFRDRWISGLSWWSVNHSPRRSIMNRPQSEAKTKAHGNPSLSPGRMTGKILIMNLFLAHQLTVQVSQWAINRTLKISSCREIAHIRHSLTYTPGLYNVIWSWNKRNIFKHILSKTYKCFLNPFFKSQRNWVTTFNRLYASRKSSRQRERRPEVHLSDQTQLSDKWIF